MATKPKKKITFQDVERRRREFSGALRDYAQSGQRYHNPAMPMPAKYYASAQVLPNRLAMFDKLPKGKVIGETGVGADNIAAEILNRAKPAKLHMFGTLESSLTDEALRDGLRSGCVVPHGEPYGLELADVPDGFFDALYLSGETAVDDVRALLNLAARKTTADGTIMVNSYAVWSTASMYHCGTAKAVNEFCTQNGWKMTYLALDPMGYYNVALNPL
ncbi:hypothetical protein N4R57_19885 [Rhodobacteraceae bacterium D3-12]|nr:hypothetical protein N4R57_19885 [Rhodobacteraceae bacterium D3-12]